MRKSLNFRSNQHGITLLEVLIALLILGTGTIALTQLQSNMIRSNTLAKQRTEAIVLAQNTIEDFRSKITAINPAKDIKSGNDEIQSDTTLFNRSWETVSITRSNGTATGDIELKVTVSWPDISRQNKQGHTQASELTTIYLSSILSSQPFSDSAIQLALSKSPPIKPGGDPTPPPDSGGGGDNNNCTTSGGMMMNGGHMNSNNCSGMGHMNGGM